MSSLAPQHVERLASVVRERDAERALLELHLDDAADVRLVVGDEDVAAFPWRQRVGTPPVRPARQCARRFRRSSKSREPTFGIGCGEHEQHRFRRQHRDDGEAARVLEDHRGQRSRARCRGPNSSAALTMDGHQRRQSRHRCSGTDWPSMTDRHGPARPLLRRPVALADGADEVANGGIATLQVKVVAKHNVEGAKSSDANRLNCDRARAVFYRRRATSRTPWRSHDRQNARAGPLSLCRGRRVSATSDSQHRPPTTDVAEDTLIVFAVAGHAAQRAHRARLVHTAALRVGDGNALTSTSRSTRRAGRVVLYPVAADRRRRRRRPRPAEGGRRRSSRSPRHRRRATQDTVAIVAERRRASSIGARPQLVHGRLLSGTRFIYAKFTCRLGMSSGFATARFRIAVIEPELRVPAPSRTGFRRLSCTTCACFGSSSTRFARARAGGGSSDTLGPLVDRAQALDAERRALIQAVEERKAARNANQPGSRAPKESAARAPTTSSRRHARWAKRSRGSRKSCADLEAKLDAHSARAARTSPLPDVPAGGEEYNRRLRAWGTPREEAGLRTALGDWRRRSGMLDFARGTKISGLGFIVFRGQGRAARARRS